ncbi:MAG: ankyrin repeat domain-containing protein [Novosphingobium sp.]
MPRAIAGILSAALAGAMMLPAPATAQFSKGYKFLEAVRKKEGQEVTDLLNEPGTTIVNARDVSSGDTALHIVTQRRDLTWMNFLIGKGANVDMRNEQGATPMQIAVSLGFAEGVEALLKGHAKVDEPGSQGETPLITAVHRRDIAIMRLLLKAGADPDRADNSGRSARDYAMLGGRSSSLVAEIESNAKPKGEQTGTRRSYGPTL